MDDANRKFAAHKEKYERLKGDVAIKLKFLDENRVCTFKNSISKNSNFHFQHSIFIYLVTIILKKTNMIHGRKQLKLGCTGSIYY